MKSWIALHYFEIRYCKFIEHRLVSQPLGNLISHNVYLKVKVEIRIKIILNIPLISLINQSVYYNMSDSEDFVDDNATEESEDEVEPNQPRINCGKRGKDIPRQEKKTFATTKDYNDSELATEIKDKFSARAIRESDAQGKVHGTL